MRMIVRELNTRSRFNLMLKQQYRSELGIISDILSVAMDCGRQGALISSIARGANLSHYTVLEKCQKLINAKLVEPIYNGKNQTFVITEKGIQLFREMQNFIETIREIKIRY